MEATLQAYAYLETTMFSFFYEERIIPPYPEHKAEVRMVFDLVRRGVLKPFTSAYTLEELDNETNADKRDNMHELILNYNITVLPVTEDSNRLASLYVAEKAISPTWETDAAHIAVATLNKMDFIVSLNFTHIVRPWTIEKVRKVNNRERHESIGIYKPKEVLEIYGQDDSGLLA
jgi:hypothetical protein